MSSAPQYTGRQIRVANTAKGAKARAISAFGHGPQCGILQFIMRHILLLMAFLSLRVLAMGQAASPQQPKPPAAQTQQPAQGTQLSDTEIQEQLTKTAAATIEWDKSSTAGAKAEAQLIKKDQDNGKAVMQYRLKVTGAPKNKLYSLIAWPITVPTPITLMEGLAIAADGTVGCPPDSTKSCGQRMKGAELKLTYSPGLGEIFRHALISEDRQSRVFFSLVPAPMIETDKSCSLEVVELNPGFGLAVVRGKGFQPGESLLFHTQSYQEVHDSQPTVNPQGEFWAMLSPWVKGRTTGTTEVSVKGKSCAPRLSFEWGAE
jgi:hypothetical protein